MFSALSCWVLLVLAQTETVTTEHFEIVTDSRDRAYIKQVADALESGYSAMAGAWTGAPADKKRYRINLHAKPADYLEKDRKLNGGRFASHWAFSHRDTGESYVVVQPRPGVPLLDRTRAVIRHEVSHLMSYRHAPREGRAPPWMAEGLCEYAAEEAERAGGGIPMNTSLEFGEAVTRVQAMIARRKFISLEVLLTGNPEALKEWLEIELWYSEAWLLVKYLAERRSEDWKKFRERFRQEGEAPASHMAEAVRAQLMDHVGGSVADLEKEWLAWIATLKPAPWWRVAGDWTLTKDGVEGAAFPDQSAYLMSANTLRSKRYRIRMEAQLEGLGFGQVDLVVMPSAEDHAASNLVKVSILRSGEASVLVRRKTEWTNVANNRIDPIFVDPKAWIRMELEVSGRTVTCRAGGKVIVQHTFKDEIEELHDVRWGVGNYDSWTRFRSIEAGSDSK